MNGHNQLHTSLRPKTNIRMVVALGVICIALLLLSRPSPWLPFIVGAALGALGGVMQILSLRESPNAFVSASSMVEIRKIMLATKWGKIYIPFFWLSNLFFLLLAILLKQNPLICYLAASIAFKFFREMITLKSTFDLGKAT